MPPSAPLATAWSSALMKSALLDQVVSSTVWPLRISVGVPLMPALDAASVALAVQSF